jgi:hypothetical protein
MAICTCIYIPKADNVYELLIIYIGISVAIQRIYLVIITILTIAWILVQTIIFMRIICK